MAVTAEAIASRLKLQLITGVDPEGKPIKRSRSYSGIKPAAVHQDVFDIGSALVSLQKHQLDAVRRLDEVELLEGI